MKPSNLIFSGNLSAAQIYGPTYQPPEGVYLLNNIKNMTYNIQFLSQKDAL